MLVYCQHGQYSLTFRALALRQRETGPMLEMLDYTIRFVSTPTFFIYMSDLLRFSSFLQLFGCESDVDWIMFHGMIWTSKIYVKTVCPVCSDVRICLYNLWKVQAIKSIKFSDHYLNQPFQQQMTFQIQYGWIKNLLPRLHEADVVNLTNDGGGYSATSQSDDTDYSHCDNTNSAGL